MHGFLVIWWETALYVMVVAILAALTAAHRWPQTAREFSFLTVVAFGASFPPLLLLHWWRTAAIGAAAAALGVWWYRWQRRKRGAR